MGKYTRLGRNTLLVFIGRVGAKCINLLMLPFYTRWLSVEDYGITDIINVYVTFILSFVSCFIADSIFIFPKNQSFCKQKEYFSSGLFFLGFSSCITALLFIIIAYIAKSYLWVNSFIDNLWLIYGMVIATFLQQFIQQFVRSIDKIQIYSITGVILTVLIAFFSSLLIPLYGVLGFVASMILSNLMAALYSLFASKSYHFISVYCIRFASCKEMLRYSIPLIPNGIMWWMVFALNRPFLEHYLGMHSVGVFAVANKFPGILTMFFTIFITSWQISVLEEFHKDDYQDFYNKIFKCIAFLLFVIFFTISLCSEIFITLFVSPDYYSAVRYIPILTLSAVFSNISEFVGCNFIAVKKSCYFFYSSIYGAITALILNIVLIPSLGILGASLSILISFVVIMLVRLYYSRSYIVIDNGLIYLFVLLLCLFLIVVVWYLKGWILYLSVSVLFLFFLLVCRHSLRELFVRISNMNRE